MRHPVYDCAYRALAREQGVRLITADRRFHAAAVNGGMAADIMLLADYP